MSTQTLTIAAIPGDGIGLEIVPAAIEVVDAAARRHGASIDWRPYDWGSDRYRRTGAMMPADGLDVGSDKNAAVGPYAPPFAYPGAIRSVVIEVGER